GVVPRVVVLELDADVPELREPVEPLGFPHVDRVLDGRVAPPPVDQIPCPLPDDRRQERFQLHLGRKAPIDLGDELLILAAAEAIDPAIDLGDLAVRGVAVGLQHQLEEGDQRQPLVVVEFAQLHGPHPKPGPPAKVNPLDASHDAAPAVMPGPVGDAREKQVSRPAETLEPARVPAPVPAPLSGVAEPPPRRNHVGSVSLLCAVVGMVACWIALAAGPFAAAPWLRIVAAGFEAATVGALAGWFAVTARFRRPLRPPTPPT